MRAGAIEDKVRKGGGGEGRRREKEKGEMDGLKQKKTKGEKKEKREKFKIDCLVVFQTPHNKDRKREEERGR